MALTVTKNSIWEVPQQQMWKTFLNVILLAERNILQTLITSNTKNFEPICKSMTA